MDVDKRPFATIKISMLVPVRILAKNFVKKRGEHERVSSNTGNPGRLSKKRVN